MTKTAVLVIVALGLLAPPGCGRVEESAEIDPAIGLVGDEFSSVGDPGDQEAPALELTGDRKKDKALLLAALKRTGAELSEAQKSYDAAIKDPDKRPEDALVRNLEGKVTALKARLAGYQTQLDQVKNGQVRPATTSRPKVDGLPVLSGDRAKDKATILAALKKSSDELKKAEEEYARLLKGDRTPDRKTVERLGAQQKEQRARVEALQGLLDQVRRK